MSDMDYEGPIFVFDPGYTGADKLVDISNSGGPSWTAWRDAHLAKVRNDMTQSNVDVLLAEALRLKEEQAELDRKLQLVQEYGEDVYEYGAVFTFDKQFTPTGIAYTYAVIKAYDGKWYTTGPRSPKGYTWQELAVWLVSGQVPVPFSTLERMIPASE
jgi:hypothetical protein